MSASTGKAAGLMVCLLFLALTACLNRAAPLAPKQPIDSWLYRTQGLVGVFPPREDVRVGDVHIYLEDPDGDRLLSLYESPSWSYLPSSALLL